MQQLNLSDFKVKPDSKNISGTPNSYMYSNTHMENLGSTYLILSRISFIPPSLTLHVPSRPSCPGSPSSPRRSRYTYLLDLLVQDLLHDPPPPSVTLHVPSRPSCRGSPSGPPPPPPPVGHVTRTFSTFLSRISFMTPPPPRRSHHTYLLDLLVQDLLHDPPPRRSRYTYLLDLVQDLLQDPPPPPSVTLHVPSRPSCPGSPSWPPPPSLTPHVPSRPCPGSPSGPPPPRRSRYTYLLVEDLLHDPPPVGHTTRTFSTFLSRISFMTPPPPVGHTTRTFSSRIYFMTPPPSLTPHVPSRPSCPGSPSWPPPPPPVGHTTRTFSSRISFMTPPPLPSHHTYLLDLLVQDLLHDLAEVLVLGLVLLQLLVLRLVLGELQTLLGDADQRLAFVLLQLLDRVLVDRVDHVQHLDAATDHTLHKRRILHWVLALARDVVDGLLVVLHARDVVLEGREVVTALGAVVTQEVRDLLAVGAVFVDAQL